jgi:hypothetical protein
MAGIMTGCASIPAGIRTPGPGVASIELDDVPFYPQERYQCGPAAVTTVLVSSGVETSLEAVTARTYLPGRQGSLRAELTAASRAAGRIPYTLDGRFSAIVAELHAGRPVLVLQNLGVEWFPRWHYSVVVGFDHDAETVVLRSGTERRRITALDTFLRTWRRGDYWAYVALKPGELPSMVDRERYFQSVSAMETLAHDEAAYLGWRAAHDRWPDSVTARFGLGNTAFAAGKLVEAELIFRNLIAADAGMLSARNNLAFVLVEQGRKEEAVAEILGVMEAATGDDALLAAYKDSYDEIMGWRN